MNDEIITSLCPQMCERLAQGTVSVIFQKSKPYFGAPFKSHIYETYDRNYAELGFCWNCGAETFVHSCKKIIGEFTCTSTELFVVGALRSDDLARMAGWTWRDMCKYYYKPEELDGNHSKYGWAWHIKDVKIYGKPLELTEFWGRRLCRNANTIGCRNCAQKCVRINGKRYKTIEKPPITWRYAIRRTDNAH